MIGLIMKSIYEFIDPVDLMVERKKELNLSFADLSNGSDIKAKSFFHKVFQRTKVYSMERVIPFASVFNIKGKKQLQYFEIMTFLYRAKAPLSIRNEILNKFRPSKYKKMG